MKRRECLCLLAALLGAAGLPALARGSAATPLNRVRDLRQDRWLSSAELLSRLLDVSSLIVGEQHDNPEHHRLERWLISTLAQGNALGGVAMEMLDSEQQELLEDIPIAARHTLSDVQLQERLDWQRGWKWTDYGPTLRLALRLEVPVLGANLSAADIREIVATDQPPTLPAAVARYQRQALMDGHCGMLPEALLDGMLAVQVARDRVMAAALEALPATGVLICGNGHARRDVGVALHAKRKPLCLGLVELVPDQDWSSALPASVDAGPPFDLVWFTGAAARGGDPCAALKARFSS